MAPIGTGAADWGTRCCSTAIAVNKQWFEFLQRRFKADWEMPATLDVVQHSLRGMERPGGISAKDNHGLSERTHRTCQARASSKPRREENESIWRGHEIPSGFPTCRASLVKRLAKGAFRRPPAKPFIFPLPFAPPPYGYRHVQTFADCDRRF